MSLKRKNSEKEGLVNYLKKFQPNRSLAKIPSQKVATEKCSSKKKVFIKKI